MKTYIVRCRQCSTKIKDQPTNHQVIYIVATDEYFCRQQCLNKHNKAQLDERT